MTLLTKALQLGYANASVSFGVLKKDTVGFQIQYAAFHKVDARLDLTNTLHRSPSTTLLTTEIFGSLFGKSYLLMSESELQFLTDNIEESEGPNFKDEFIKEVDNILSASVITELSNELRLKIYGDTPVLVGSVQFPIDQVVASDFRQSTGDLFVTAANFSFSSEPSVKPLFIWVIDTESLTDL